MKCASLYISKKAAAGARTRVHVRDEAVYPHVDALEVRFKRQQKPARKVRIIATAPVASF